MKFLSNNRRTATTKIQQNKTHFPFKYPIIIWHVHLKNSKEKVGFELLQVSFNENNFYYEYKYSQERKWLMQLHNNCLLSIVEPNLCCDRRTWFVLPILFWTIKFCQYLKCLWHHYKILCLNIMYTRMSHIRYGPTCIKRWRDG